MRIALSQLAGAKYKRARGAMLMNRGNRHAKDDPGARPRIEPELRKQRPRSARLRPGVYVRTLLALALLGAVACALWASWGSLRRMGLLLEQGQQTDGRITNRYVETDEDDHRSYRAEYEFQVGGATYRGSGELKDVTEYFMPGPCKVTYLPSDPSINTINPVTGDQLGLSYLFAGFFALILLALGGFFGALFVQMVRRIARELPLARRGAAAVGVVTALVRSTDSTRTLRYRFEAEGGKVQTGQATLESERRFAVGEHLTVLYDPDRPEQALLYRELAFVSVRNG
jgi:hypothetical protein